MTYNNGIQLSLKSDERLYENVRVERAAIIVQNGRNRFSNKKNNEHY